MSDAETPQLSIEFRDAPCPSQPLAAIGLEDANLLDALSQFDPYGAWCVDLETGMVYWTRDVFEIHGMPYKEGPIDLALAISRYHPDDRELVMNCIEEATERKTGFRFVLRLATPDGHNKLVRASGLYRVNSQGKGEVFGAFSQFQPRVRTVAVNS